VGLVLGAGATPSHGDSPKDPEPPKPDSRSERTILGWTVLIDDRLFLAPNIELGETALVFLRNDLANIANLLDAERLAKLRAVRIVLDLGHGKLRPMQYHPSADWLEKNGYARELARCVHIPVASGYTSRRHRHEQPWCVLHELAHAYHDQVLGFDEPRIRTAWEAFKTSGHGFKVLHINGRRTHHYALTDQKEFFAEMSESYLGMNDFYPFNNAELKEAEPEIWTLLESIWGRIP
jgi:hypothetical protein